MVVNQAPAYRNPMSRLGPLRGLTARLLNHSPGTFCTSPSRWPRCFDKDAWKGATRRLRCPGTLLAGPSVDASGVWRLRRHCALLFVGIRPRTLAYDRARKNSCLQRQGSATLKCEEAETPLGAPRPGFDSANLCCLRAHAGHKDLRDPGWIETTTPIHPFHTPARAISHSLCDSGSQFDVPARAVRWGSHAARLLPAQLARRLYH
jgi:hypothetical protein